MILKCFLVETRSCQVRAEHRSAGVPHKFPHLFPQPTGDELLARSPSIQRRLVRDLRPMV
jgi:hypothetical protein